MDKKLLVSLMMAAPTMAFAAQWNANDGSGTLSYDILPDVTTGDNWMANGTGSTTLNGSVLTLTPGYSSLSYLLPGDFTAAKYDLSVGTLNNAVIKVNNVYLAKKINGKYVDSSDKALKDQDDVANMVPLTSGTYELKAGIAIEVVRQNPVNDWKVSTVSLSLNGVNFATIKSALENNLPAESAITKITSGNKYQTAAGLAGEYANLVNERDAIVSDIDMIDLTDGDALISAYNYFQLGSWKATLSASTDNISMAIKAFKGNLDVYNPKAKDANDKWQNYLDNNTAKDNWIKVRDNLQTTLDTNWENANKQILATPDGTNKAKYCAWVLADDKANGQNMIDAFGDAIESAYSGDAMYTKFTFDPTKFGAKTETDIRKYINGLDYATASADWDAYKKFLEVTLPSVTTAYNKDFNAVNDVIYKLDPQYNPFTQAQLDLKLNENVYADAQGQAFDALIKAYNQNTGYAIVVGNKKNPIESTLNPNNPNIRGAQANTAAAEATASERIAELDQINTEFQALVVNQQGQWSTAVSKIASFVTEYNDYNEIINSEAFQSLKELDPTAFGKIQRDVETINTKINTLKKVSQEEYLAHNLDVNVDPYKAAKVAVDQAISQYDTDKAAVGGAMTLMTELRNQQNFVASETAKVKKYNLKDKFDDTFNNLEQSIQDYYLDPNKTSATYNRILNAIKHVSTDCNDLVTSINNVLTKINSINSQITALETAVNGKQIVKIDGEPAFTVGDLEYDFTLNGGVTETLSIEGLKALVAQYQTQIDEIGTGKTDGEDNKYVTPAVAINGATEESNTINGDDLVSQVPQAKAQFLKDITQKNYDAVKAVADDIQEKKTESPYDNAEGMADVDTELSFPKTYTGMKTLDAVAAKMLNATEAELKTCDNDLQYIANAYSAVYAEIEKVVNNYDAWKRLEGSQYNSTDVTPIYGGVALTVKTVLDTFYSDIQATEAPASGHYEGEYNTLKSTLESYCKQIETAYKNQQLQGANSKEESFKTLLNGLKSQISGMNTDMKNNTKYFNAQRNKATEIGDEARDLLQYLDDHDKVVNPDVENNREYYKAQVNDVLTQIAGLNVEITKSFGAGKSEDHNPTYEQRFNDLKDKLDLIRKAEDKDYKEAVEKSNELYLASKYLGGNILDNLYDNAINEVNEYRYDVKNVNYYDALMSNSVFVENHNELQECYARVIKLDADVAKYVAGLYPAGSLRDQWPVLSDGHTVAVSNGIKWVDIETEGASLQKKITTCLTNVRNAAVSEANNFYTQNNGYAETVWTNLGGVKDRLLTAGLTNNTVGPDGKTIEGEVTKQIGSQLATLAALQASYTGYQTSMTKPGITEEQKITAEHDYIIGMGDIANKLAEILPKYDDRSVPTKLTEYANSVVLKAVNDQWKANYDNVKALITGYQTEISAYATDTDIQADAAKINTALTEVEAKNTEWNRLANNADTRTSNFNRLDNLGLDVQLANAKAAYESAKTTHEVKVNNNEAYNKLLSLTNPDSELNKLYKDLDKLLEWTGYHTSQVNTYDNIKNTDIDGANGVVKTVDALVTSTTTKADADALITSKFVPVQTKIKNSYKQMYQDELAYANTLVFLANSAFNDAKVKEEPATRAEVPNLDEYDARIKAVIAGLDQLKRKTYTFETKDALMDQVYAYENELSNIIGELEAYSKPGGEFGQPLFDKSIEELDNTYNTLNTTFTTLLSDINTQGEAANTKYGNYGDAVKNEFAPGVDAAIKTLSGYYTDYSGLYYLVIPQTDKYEYLMDQLSSDVAAIKTAWALKQAEAKRKATSDNKYDSLVEELEGLESDVNYAHNEVLEYNNDSDPALTGYNELQVVFEGVTNTEHPSLSIPSLYKKLESRRIAHTLDATSTLNGVNGNSQMDIQTYVNSYVRYDLQVAAGKYVKSTNKYAEDVIEDLRNPGPNDKGWEQTVLHLGQTVNNIETEQVKLEDINVEAIDGIWKTDKDLLTPLFIANTDKQARDVYDEVHDAIKAVYDAINGIYTDAVENDLIVKGNVADVEEGQLNILDVQTLISIVLEEEQLEGNDKEIADVNNDDKVTVADVTSLINIIMSKQNVNNGRFYLRQYIHAESGNNTYRVEEITGENGLRRYAVNLANEVAFTSGQLDIKLPGNGRIADIHIGNRAQEFELLSSENGDHTRVMLVSMDNALIDGNNGCVLYIDVEGNSEVEVSNVIFSDVNGNSYDVNSFGTNGISDIYESLKDGVKSIYNAAGQKLNKLTKGVNIIRNADGSTTKKIGK